MIDIRSIHRQAMLLVREANEELQKMQVEAFVDISKKAFNLERDAARALLSNWDAEPTRSVLFRSAATLAFNIGEFDEAKKLVYQGLAGKPHSELAVELNYLLERINEAVEQSYSQKMVAENAYVELLRDKAVNVKLEPKDPKYNKAIVLDYIIDFLKNIQNSYANYSVANFRKTFTERDFPDYDGSISTLRSESKTLAVNFSFNSFGVSIVADTEIMGFNEFNSRKFKSYKKELFDSFKSEVLLPDFNSDAYHQMIENKYTPEERQEIFTPIVSALDPRSKYTLAITDRYFKRIVKRHPALNKKSKSVLKPSLEKVAIEDYNVMRRTFELVSPSAGKKQKLMTDYLTYAEFQSGLENVEDGDKKVYFINRYEYKIVWNQGVFTIDDQYFDMFVETKNFNEIDLLFGKKILQKYASLLQRPENELSANERLVLNRMNAEMMRDWSI